MEASVLPGNHLLCALAALPDANPVVLFVRHAERYAIEDYARGDTAMLTPAGEQSARAFGARLPLTRTLHVFHSRITRCKVTAERMAEGFAAAGGRVTFEGELDGLCGSFVRDSERVALLTRQHKGANGDNDFVRDWFDGRFDPAVIAPCHDAAEQLRRLAATVTAHAAPDSLTILVTHDWDIMTLRETFLQARHEQVGWVDFLDGLAISCDGDAMEFHWREFTARREA